MESKIGLVFFVTLFNPIDNKEINGDEYTENEDAPVIHNRQPVKQKISPYSNDKTDRQAI